MENSISGGYTSLRAFDADEKNLFDQVICQIPGAQHIPLAVATQVVNGIKYAYLCVSKPFHPEAEDYNTLVIIYKPLPNVGKAPSLLEIKTVKII